MTDKNVGMIFNGCQSEPEALRSGKVTVYDSNCVVVQLYCEDCGNYIGPVVANLEHIAKAAGSRMLETLAGGVK